MGPTTTESVATSPMRDDCADPSSAPSTPSPPVTRETVKIVYRQMPILVDDFASRCLKARMAQTRKRQDVLARALNEYENLAKMLAANETLSDRQRFYIDEFERYARRFRLLTTPTPSVEVTALLSTSMDALENDFEVPVWARPAKHTAEELQEQFRAKVRANAEQGRLRRIARSGLTEEQFNERTRQRSEMLNARAEEKRVRLASFLKPPKLRTALQDVNCENCAEGKAPAIKRKEACESPVSPPLAKRVKVPTPIRAALNSSPDGGVDVRTVRAPARPPKKRPLLLFDEVASQPVEPPRPVFPLFDE